MIAATSLVDRVVGGVVGMLVAIVGRKCEGRLRSRGRRWRGIEAGRPRGVRSSRMLVVVKHVRGVPMTRGVICVLSNCRWDGRVVRVALLVSCSESTRTPAAWSSLAPVSLSLLRDLRGRD